MKIEICKIAVTLFAATIMVFTGNAAQRTLHRYSGNYKGGTATYTFYEDENENRVLHGAYSYNNGSYNEKGVYKNGVRDGVWHILKEGYSGDQFFMTVPFADGKVNGTVICAYKAGAQPAKEMRFNVSNNHIISYRGLADYDYAHGGWVPVPIKGSFDGYGYPHGSWDYNYEEYGEKHNIHEEYYHGLFVKGRDKNLATGEIRRFSTGYDSIDPEKYVELAGNGPQEVLQVVAKGYEQNLVDTPMYDYATRIPKKVYDYLKNFIGDDVIDDYVKCSPYRRIESGNRAATSRRTSTSSRKSGSATEITEKIVDEPNSSSATNNTEQIFTEVEQMPSFPGGEAALFKYISDHLHYPLLAQENNIQGRVLVKFVVRKDGSVGDVQVLRSVDPSLDKEAIRLVKSLPRFTPGKLNGQPVNAWYTIPITFRLSL